MSTKGWQTNTQMWKGVSHEWNPDEKDTDWNIAHVRNAIANYGSVPYGLKNESTTLMDAMLSNNINMGINMARMTKNHKSVRAMHHEAVIALENNDILRARTLMIDWELEHER